MHIAEVVTIAKSLPLLRLNTYKSLILSYSADYRRIFLKKQKQNDGTICAKRFSVLLQTIFGRTGIRFTDPSMLKTG